mgnify:CR=1 FL=1
MSIVVGVVWRGAAGAALRSNVGGAVGVHIDPHYIKSSGLSSIHEVCVNSTVVLM